MSTTTKKVYVRSPIARYDADFVKAIYDPDPDPDPALGMLALLVGIAVIGVISYTNPDLWNNFLVGINPEIAKAQAEAEEAKLEYLKEQAKLMGDAMNKILLGLAIVSGIILVYMFWRHKESKKNRKAMRRKLRL